MNKGASGQQEYDEQDEGGGNDEAEPISGENASKAQPLAHIFGEQVARKLFSKTWQFRDEALNEIENMVCRD